MAASPQAGAASQSLIAGALDLLTPREIHDALSPRERMALRYCWPAHQRPLFRRDDGTWGGQAAPPGQWVVWLVSAGRGFGKALALDTQIPTPSGWSRMADLCVGDAVFDEAGRPCRVTATFDTLADRAYRVRFSDGSFLDACSEHQWVTVGDGFSADWAATTPAISTAEMLRGSRRHLIPMPFGGHVEAVSADPIAPQPMRCIAVDSQHSMYLAGEAMIPTHNTRLGAEWIRDRAMRFPKTRWAIVGETADEARKVMLKGESGLLSVCAPWEKPHFNFTDQALEFPNGSLVYLYSAEKPEKFRGPQFHGAWLDEFPKWRRMREAWDHIRFGVRLPLRGDRPRVVITTTPRPNKLLREIRARGSTVITTGSTYENQANLDQSFLDELANWKDSKLGQQEIYGTQFDEAPGAIFMASWIEKARVKEAPRLRRIVVAVDPSSSDTDKSDETGIVVAGLGEDGRGYVLEDASIRCTPDRWARRAVEVYHRWGADCVVAETTMGGDLVPTVIKLVDSHVPVKIKGGNRGKISRAEPVAALYEQGKVSHVGSLFDELENQMVNYVLGARESPDRMDAMVYAINELMLPKDVPLVFR